MLKTERQRKILDIITQRKHCTVKFLAETLFVSPITVRRDLDTLEGEGLVTRCYGGVSVPRHLNREVPLEVRENSNTDVKGALARRAAGELKNGDTVFLDASSTALHIVDFVYPEQNLTFITNSIRALIQLKDRHIRCYSTGGMLLENSFALVGSLAIEAVSKLNADIMFFSTQGITEAGEITDFSEAETQLRKAMMKNAKKTVYMFDSSKLNKKYLFSVCRAQDTDKIITDIKIDFSRAEKPDNIT